MREILFRAKNRSGSWSYGDLHLHCNHPHLHALGNGARSTYIDTSTVGQFTGTFDKKGERIFEGDFLQIEDEKNVKVTTLVCWDETRCGFIAKPLKKQNFNCFILGLWHRNNSEIIGNRWDNNPESVQ